MATCTCAASPIENTAREHDNRASALASATATSSSSRRVASRLYKLAPDKGKRRHSQSRFWPTWLVPSLRLPSLDLRSIIENASRPLSRSSIQRRECNDTNRILANRPGRSNFLRFPGSRLCPLWTPGGRRFWGLRVANSSQTRPESRVSNKRIMSPRKAIGTPGLVMLGVRYLARVREERFAIRIDGGLLLLPRGATREG